MNSIYFISMLSILISIIGCNKYTDYRDIPFVKDNIDSIYSPEHIELCSNNPCSIFCTNSASIGDIHPTKEYVISVLEEMNSNFTYKIDSTWHYNDSIYEHLKGDCEDITSTMIQHMVNDGVDKKHLYIAFRFLDDNNSHVFLAVDTIDSGLLHLDYANSGYPIEENINFHMKMTDVGIYKWIKGNIK